MSHTCSHAQSPTTPVSGLLYSLSFLYTHTPQALAQLHIWSSVFPESTIPAVLAVTGLVERSHWSSRPGLEFCVSRYLQSWSHWLLTPSLSHLPHTYGWRVCAGLYIAGWQVLYWSTLFYHTGTRLLGFESWRCRFVILASQVICLCLGFLIYNSVQYIGLLWGFIES